MSDPSEVRTSFDVTLEPLEGWDDFAKKAFGFSAKITLIGTRRRRRIRAPHVTITAGQTRYRRRYERIRRQHT